ncbi:MAG TPA: phage holin family protein, partial [Anaerolineaceae bacterium]|nr:phage holin family protein [Anaerolineaceae bacterium]
MNQKFLLRVLINAFALFIAVKLVNIEMQNESVWAFLILGLFFGIANTVLKPVLMVLGCTFVVLTLGLFTLVINTFLFALVGAIGHSLGI